MGKETGREEAKPCMVSDRVPDPVLRKGALGYMLPDPTEGKGTGLPDTGKHFTLHRDSVYTSPKAASCIGLSRWQQKH